MNFSRLISPLVLACTLGLATASATTVVGPMSVARYNHTAIGLPDGRVLIAGGTNAQGTTARSEIYNPLTASFSPAPDMAVGRTALTSAPLPDGRVMVLGGTGLVGGVNASLASTEIFDPATGLWSAGASMSVARSGAKAVTLSDGKIVVVGGVGTAATEIYDPVTQTFTPGAPLSAARGGFAMVALPDDRVLVVGGYYLLGNGGNALPGEVRDPRTGAWSATGPLAFGRSSHTATLLSDGRVLVAGGSGVLVAELFDPTNLTFTATGSLNTGHYMHTATRLSSGNVLLAGGNSSTSIDESYWEHYDVASGLWRKADVPTQVLRYHTSTLLADGKVLIGGGYPGPVATAQTFAENCGMYNTTLSTNRIEFPGVGGSANLTVGMPGECSWSTYNLPSWISATPGPNGTGTSTITLTAAPGGTAWRGNYMRIANLDFNVGQPAMPPVCDTSVTPTLSVNSASILAAGSSNSVSVTIPAGCNWSVTGVPSWVTVTSGAAGGTGNGFINYTVAPNSGAARSATLTIATRPFTISQGAYVAGCDPAAPTWIFPNSQTFGAAGGSGSVTVSRGASCTWTTTWVPSWITVTAGASGTGPGTVTYTVAPNTGAARQVNLSIAGYLYNVAQSAGSGTPVPSCPTTALTVGVSASGALAAGDCNSGQRGSAYYTDRYTFSGTAGQRVAIQLTSSAFDTYLYLKSPTNTLVGSDDDGGGGTNSRLPASSGFITLPASGTYVIEATSYGAGAGGNYSVVVLAN